MKKLNHLLVFFMGILVISCVDHQEDPTQDTEKTIPPGSREVQVNIDSKYDLSNTIAYGISDTLDMSASRLSLISSSGEKDIVYFVDKNSKKIKAVATLLPSENELNINATTVTAALHDIIPSYLSLSPDDRTKFNQSASSLPEYQNLMTRVDALLAGGEGIYTPSDGYVADLRAVSSYISKNYTMANKSSGAAARTTTQNLAYWIKEGPPFRIANQSYTSVNARLTPVAGGSNSNYLMNPRPLTFDYSQESITEINAINGEYYLNLSQSANGAREKNEYAFANNILAMSLGESFFNRINGDGAEACADAIMALVQDDFDMIYANPPANEQEAFYLAIDIISDILPSVVRNQYCIQTFVNNEVLIYIMAERILMLMAVVDQNTLLQEMGGFAFYFESLYLPFEFENRIKVEDGYVTW